MNLSTTVSAAIWLKDPCVIIRLRPGFCWNIYEAVCARMQQENAMLDTPGVVENLEGDTDPVE